MGEIRPAKASIDAPALDGGAEIRVNTRTLAAFATTLRADFDKGVAPAANQVQLAFSNGAVVGAANPSADLETMLNTYNGCVTVMSQQLFAYIDFATMLTTAAHAISQQYTTTDELAKASGYDIDNALSNASPVEWSAGPRRRTGAAL